MGRPGDGLRRLQELLGELRRRGWTLILWGPRTSPSFIAAMFRWRDCADVLLVRNDHQATGYRVPTPPGRAEVFNPDVVLYQYHQFPLWTLRAMLSLPRPKAPECFLPENLPRPVMIRPLSPHPRPRK